VYLLLPSRSWQVRLGGPLHAHGTLDIEGMMVFFKVLCGSRTNQEAGLARQYPQTEEAFYWSLTADDLEIPANLSPEYTCTASSGQTTLDDARLGPLEGLLGLLLEEMGCHPILASYYNELRVQVGPSKRVSKASTKARK
jgi:hypothetical protein